MPGSTPFDAVGVMTGPMAPADAAVTVPYAPVDPRSWHATATISAPARAIDVRTCAAILMALSLLLLTQCAARRRRGADRFRCSPVRRHRPRRLTERGSRAECAGSPRGAGPIPAARRRAG